MTAKHVIFNGGVFLYQDKAPFVRIGKSIQGALEYDQESDRLKCHECGEFKSMLGRHVNVDHGLPSREYKKKYGLNQTTALVPEVVRIRLSGITAAIRMNTYCAGFGSLRRTGNDCRGHPTTNAG